MGEAGSDRNSGSRVDLMHFYGDVFFLGFRKKTVCFPQGLMKKNVLGSGLISIFEGIYCKKNSEILKYAKELLIVCDLQL